MGVVMVRPKSVVMVRPLVRPSAFTHLLSTLVRRSGAPLKCACLMTVGGWATRWEVPLVRPLVRN